MDSRELTKSQGEALFQQTHKMLGYLGRLIRRIEAQKFPADDPLYEKAKATYDIMFDLNRLTHHLACNGQTGGMR